MLGADKIHNLVYAYQNMISVEFLIGLAVKCIGKCLESSIYVS